jgi:tight adherence protein C
VTAAAALLPAAPAPSWAAAAALVSLACLALATAATLWVGQRGRRAVLGRLVRPGGRAGGGRGAVTALGTPDAFGIAEVGGWRGDLLASLARWVPAGLRTEAAVAALARAGYFEPSAALYYGAARIVAPVAAPLAALAVGGDEASLAAALGLLAGVVGPSAVLDRKAGARRLALSAAIPDALDLLIVCLEAGVGIDAALVRVARELETTHPVLAAELDNVTRRISAGLPREESLRALVARTGVEDLRAIVSTMIQAERLGTSLARVLRIHGDALRARRRQAAEKRAAEASVKMIVPLVLFLLPAFFTVVLGPAVLGLMTNVMGEP